MLRKVVLLASVAALFGSMVLITGSAHASTTPINPANYSVTCDTLSKNGIKFAPPLVLGGTQSDVIKIKGTLQGCAVTKANSSDPDIHVISGGVVGLLNSNTNDCLSLLGSSAATGSITVKWKTLEKLTVATTTTQITGGNVSGGTANPFSDAATYGTFSISGAAVTGAFLGTDNGASSFTKALTQAGIGVLGGCAASPPVPLKGITLGSTETHFG